jgi:hypothetical protein
MVGLANVDNTTDLLKPVSTATQTALDTKAAISGQVFTGAVSATNLSGTNTGDQDLSSFATSANLALKADIASPTFTGTVGGIDKTMVGLANVDNTTDLLKPVSTATQTALDTKAAISGQVFTGAVSATNLSGSNTGDQDLSSFATSANLALKANIASPTFTGTVGGIDKTMVGLANVDNTTDAAKPVSTATQTALDTKAAISGQVFTGAVSATNLSGSNTGDQDLSSFATSANLALKADIASPTFTGTVGGIDQTMVGLANVDNTTDAAKPVSTATQSALNLKANIESPILTGIPLAPTPAANTNTTQIATTAFVAGAITAANGTNANLTGMVTSAGNTTTVVTNANLTGDVSSSGNATTIGANKVLTGMIADGTIVTADIADGAITNAKIADGTVTNVDLATVASKTFKGRTAAGTGAVEDLTVAQVRSDLAINNVDNTNDAAKPISTLTQTALNLKANITSPTFTGAPLAPTAALGTATTQIATTLFVNSALSNADANYVKLTGSQTIAGAKTFSSELNIQGMRVGSGTSMTFVGLNSAASGENSSAFGTFASATADRTTALGKDTNATGLNSTALGFGASVAANHTVQLGNTAVTNVKTSGTVTAGTVTYPNAHNSSAGQVLTVNATGTATWASAAPTVREEANEFTATVSQTAFTLVQTPSLNSKVKMYVNGIRISKNAYTLSGPTVTYVPANNGAYALTAGDRIQFDYFY